MTPTPTLTGQDIGEAENAIRAVLDRLLARTDTEFPGWVVLNVLHTNGATLATDELVDRVTHGLKVDAATVHSAVSTLAEHELIATSTGGQSVTLTPAGEDRFSRVRDGIGQITRRLYGDIPADDLATAHRVLSTVTARANAELVA